MCEEKEGCLGCREGTCPEKERCRPYECAQSRALEGCWQCEEFPCQAPVLQSLRTQAFVGYISKFGMEKILDRLEEGEKDGIVYHHPGLLTGDYDGIENEEDTCVSMEKQFLMMDTILYLYKLSRTLVSMGHPMSVLKEEKIFDKVIAIKYDVPNDRLEMFAQYRRDIDTFYQRVLEKNA